MQLFLFFNQNFSFEAQVFFVAVFALIFGSFATLFSHRLASKEPIVFGRSKCVNCGFKLKALNLIPLFSWIFQRGKCVNCHKKISIRYPLIELTFLSCFLTIFLVLHHELNWKMILYFLIASTLIIMCVIDLEHYFIPDSTQYFLAILTTILLLLEGGNAVIFIHLKSAILYCGFGLLLFGFFYFAARIEAIGIDDIKFFFVAGFLLGINNFLSFTMLTGLLGLFFGVTWQKFTKEDLFPFAPAICFATFLCLLFDKKINPIELLGSLIF